MTDEVTASDQANHDDLVAELHAQTERLERQLADVEQEARTRLVRAELKVEAVRAGIIDLDGLKLLDTSGVELTPGGEVANAAQLIAVPSRGCLQLGHRRAWQVRLLHSRRGKSSRQK